MKNIFHSNDNCITDDTQIEMLKDVSRDGKEVDWVFHKLKTFDLAASYKRLGGRFLRKEYRVKECGSYLEFRRYQQPSLSPNGRDLKLNRANFCKVRLCPMCSWRRSLKIFGQVSRIMDSLGPEFDYLFLTLTTRNCHGSSLSETIDLIFRAFNKMTRRTIFKQSIKGFFRALEVTHNLDFDSLWFDTYHPHLHVILVVNKSYFTDNSYYISQAAWTDLWYSCLDVDYKPIVDIRRLKNIKGKGIAEVAKYSVKSNDYIIKNEETQEIVEEMTDRAVFLLDVALAHRRLTSFGGILKHIHKELNLDDPIDGDLINTDNADDDLRSDLGYVIERYSWNIGYKQYLRIGGDLLGYE